MTATGEPTLPPAVDRRVGGSAGAALARVLTFRRLKWTSFIHSVVYTALLVCAFALHKPQPETFVLGLSHGLLWIGMSLACILATRLRVIPLRVAAAVAVLGGIGPFFGSAEFARESRRRSALAPPSTGAAAQD